MSRARVARAVLRFGRLAAQLDDEALDDLRGARRTELNPGVSEIREIGDRGGVDPARQRGGLVQGGARVAQ